VSYYNQKGFYPYPWVTASTVANKDMTWAIAIEDLLKKQVDLSSLPADPTKWNQFTWIKADLSTASSQVAAWQYGYAIVTKNGIPAGWFVLMARPETEWWANFVSGYIIKSWDISNFRACTSFSQNWAPSGSPEVPATWDCTYGQKADLRYIYIF
jgi:hypothetical protein